MHHHAMLLHSRPKCSLLLSPCTARKQVETSTKCRLRCAANRQQPSSSSNGNTAPQQQQQQEEDDPVAAMLWAAQQDGLKILCDDDPDEMEDLEDILEDLEDPWMRNPSPPEWSESPLFAVPDSSSNSSSTTGAAAAAAGPSSSDPDITPSSQFVTLNWQQLEQLVQPQQQQQQQQVGVVLLEVRCPPADQQQEQQPPCRPLPDPLPWLSIQQQQQQQQQVTPLQPHQVHRVTVELSALSRELAAEWQQQGAVVAVWDSGHHSSLAAAIRLSAVYRLPQVVLLQQA